MEGKGVEREKYKRDTLICYLLHMPQLGLGIESAIQVCAIQVCAHPMTRTFQPLKNTNQGGQSELLKILNNNSYVTPSIF